MVGLQKTSNGAPRPNLSGMGRYSFRDLDASLSVFSATLPPRDPLLKAVNALHSDLFSDRCAQAAERSRLLNPIGDELVTICEKLFRRRFKSVRSILGDSNKLSGLLEKSAHSPRDALGDLGSLFRDRVVTLIGKAAGLNTEAIDVLSSSRFASGILMLLTFDVAARGISRSSIDELGLALGHLMEGEPADAWSKVPPPLCMSQSNGRHLLLGLYSSGDEFLRAAAANINSFRLLFGSTFGRSIYLQDSSLRIPLGSSGQFDVQVTRGVPEAPHALVFAIVNSHSITPYPIARIAVNLDLFNSEATIVNIQGTRVDQYRLFLSDYDWAISQLSLADI